MGNIVAIVGRPNVGKSTFFNRLIGERKAIMDDESGVTRDRHYGKTEWNGTPFTVVDTGGYVVGSEDVFEAAIRRQVEIAIEESDVVLFMVDTQSGLHPLDEEFAKVLRRYDKPIMVVANKAETLDRTQQAAEFYTLGFDKIFPISAQTGSGTGDLLDEVVKHLTPTSGIAPDEGIPRIAIIGKPNVGKSSFVNLLLGEERNIVTDIAGTTRDAIDTHYKSFGKEFILTDTAGLRRKNRIKDSIEFYSVMRTLRAIEQSDVCIMMVDAQEGITSQDISILRLAEKDGKGMVLMVNKWDLIEKDHMTYKRYLDVIRQKISPMDYIPVLFTSVLNKQRVFQTIETAIRVYENKQQRVPTSKLNEVMQQVIAHYPPPAYRGHHIKIKYITQLPTRVPSFAFFCNHPKYIPETYRRYLENQLRKHFDFEGVPIRLYFREK
ncbi:GTP-binding protein [Thermonema lapsum]|jgi:GTP-binding protein|uniref:GTPase Der n=1 Tax=Thermonema lapsum TaxID=28195 RepID=A0A846MRK3_9BACT|nr:ribosome biogenesis GTPase Der [Thermonema lapsum]NIK74214.1 GTP-binding protein [Thermonema lapsum]